MFDVAVMEAEWAAFDATPGCYDDVEPPVDVWADPPSITDRAQALSATVGLLAADIAAAAPVADDAELVGWLTSLATATDRLPTADHAIVAELDARGTAERFLYPSTARLLTGELRVRPGAATARVLAARQIGPRRAFTGESLPPLREHVAAAQAAGVISADHAQVITTALAGVGDHVDPELVDVAEQALVGLARQVDPATLARGCRQAVEVLDPDGTEPRDAVHDRRRSLVLFPGDDGSGRITGTLTPDVFAALQAVLSPLAAPRPDDPVAGRDVRTAAQRHHDALGELCQRFLRSGTLPHSGGTPATVIVTMTLEQLEARAGLVVTSFGASMTIDRLLKYAGECELIPAVLAEGGGVLAYGRTRRIATPGQTTALIARDKGCVIPGCQTPAEWCERHHVIPWADGGVTDVDNLALICRYHHRMFEKCGWAIVMHDGRPWCRPPTLLDPEQKLIRNTHWDTFEPPDATDPMPHPQAVTPQPPRNQPPGTEPPADPDPDPDPDPTHPGKRGVSSAFRCQRRWSPQLIAAASGVAPDTGR